MPNKNRNGLDDLDILDLDDLLREDDRETTNKQEQKAPEQTPVGPQKREGSTPRRHKPRQAPSDKAASEKLPQQESVREDSAESQRQTEPSAEQEKGPVKETDPAQKNSGHRSASAETKGKENEPASQSSADMKEKKSKAATQPAADAKERENEAATQPAAEEDLPDGINFVDVVPMGDTLKRAPGGQSPKRRVPGRPASGKDPRPESEDNGRSRKAPVAGRPSGIPQKSALPEVSEGETESSGRRRLPLHLILPIVIVAVLVIAVVRFMVWSKGTDLHIDSSGNADRFNIEVNDNMVYLPDSKLEGHEDDGVTTILCLGNEPFSEDTSDTGLAGQIASLGNCNVINAAFPDSQVTCENAAYSTDSLDSMDDIFNLFYVSYAISIGDFSSLKTVASVHTEDPTYERSVEALENTDFSKVDMIAIMYDGIDYINGMAMQNPDVPDELTTYVGSLINSFQLIQEKYPYIRIVFLSPYYAEYDGASSRTTDLGNGTIVNYFQWAYDTCGDCSVSFLDNYYGSINETNYKDYLSDGIHLNAAGRTKVADHFVYKVLQDNYAEYNAQTLSVAKQ